MKKEKQETNINNKALPIQDPFDVMWVNPDLNGGNNLKYRKGNYLIKNLTKERFKDFAKIKDKLKFDVVSDVDYGILVPKILDPFLFSNNEIALLSGILNDWIRNTIKKYPDKKEDLNELKIFVNDEAIKNIKKSKELQKQNDDKLDKIEEETLFMALTTKTKKITIPEIALLYVYNDEKIIGDRNAADIAKRYDYSSQTTGQQLYDDYKKYLNRDSRININENDRTAKNMIKRIENILPYIKNDSGKILASSELSIIKKKL